MPCNQVVVQTAHAIMELGRNNKLSLELDHPYLVVCSCKDEKELIKIYNDIISKNIECYKFHESDIDDQLTAIATVPVFQQDRKHFKKLRLLNLAGGAT